MNSELLKQYAALRAAISEMEKQEAEMKAQILEHLRGLGQSTISTQYGVYTVAKRTTYEFSDEVKKRELELKEAKAVEIEAGAAKPKETEYLSFRP